MGPYVSLCVLIGFFSSACVFMGLYRCTLETKNLNKSSNPLILVKNKRFIFMFLKRCFYAFVETEPLKIPSILVSQSTFLCNVFKTFV